MSVLAIETATSAIALALADDDGLLASMEVRAGRRHAELLHPIVEHLLELAGLELAEVTAVGVDVGPGLFTGIRVGVAAAKGYAMALGVPVVGLTSLEILRLGCEAAGLGDAVPVVDLRRGEVAWSLRPAPGEERHERHGPPEELVAELSAVAERAGRFGARVVLAGDGARRYAELFRSSLGDRAVVAGAELSVPPVGTLALRAVAEAAASTGLDPEEIGPRYLRDADVRIGWTTRHDAPGRAGVA